MFGLNTDSTVAQGMSIFEHSLANRRLFLLGDWYFGADGYITEEQGFKMYSHILDISFENDSFHFSLDNISQGSKEEIKQNIKSLYDIQYEWVERILCKG